MRPCRARDRDSDMMPKTAAVVLPGMAVPYIIHMSEQDTIHLLTHVKCLQP